MLEEYMAGGSGDSRWITVEDLRDHFLLERKDWTSISGFLKRIYKRPYRNFPYIVTRFERQEKSGKKTVFANRYLLKRREGFPEPSPSPGLPVTRDPIIRV
ncbi:MAG: hypothetical protein ABFC24_11140 [Methanoregulaceae archaeon]